MGYFQQDTQELGLSTPSGVMPNNADAYRTLGDAVSMGVSSFSKIQQDKQQAQAQADMSEMADRAAIDAVSAEDAVERERSLSEEELRVARASGDSERLQLALEQAGSRQRTTISALNRAMLGRLDYWKQKGMAAQYLKAYSDFTGKKTADFDQIGDTTTEVQKQQAKMQEDMRNVLRDNGVVPTGDPTIDTNAFTNIQARNKKVIDSAKEVGYNQTEATKWDASQGSAFRAMTGGFLSSTMRQIMSIQDPEQRQAAADSTMRTMGTFQSALVSARDQGLLGKTPRENQQVYEAILRNDAYLNQKNEKFYQEQFTVFSEMLKEQVTKGLVNADLQARANALTNESKIATFDWLENAYPNQGKVLMDLVAKSPQIAAEIMAAINATREGEPTTNIKAAQQASELLTQMRKQTGVNPTKSFEKQLKGLTSSISFAAQSSIPDKVATALNSITPELWEMLPQSAERTNLVTSVDNIIRNASNQMNKILEDAGLDGKLSDYVTVRVLTDGGVILQPRTGAKLLPREVQDALSKPSIIAPAIKAYSIIHGVDPKEASKVLDIQVETKPKEDKVGSALDLTGLDEADVMDIQSYILELRAKQSRSSMVS